jgi:hypothetical protein
LVCLTTSGASLRVMKQQLAASVRLLLSTEAHE